MRIVVAPDSFKGTVDAQAVAEAVRDGWLSARPGDDVAIAPMADGGEGTGAILRGRVPDGVAVVELAETSGIALPGRLGVFDAHTFGLGAQLREAIEGGARQVLVGLGGSSSTDGGAGALMALGARILDEQGEPVPLGNAGLARAASVDLSGLVPLPPGGVVVLADVANHLLGERGAAAVFGPQKGARPEDVPVLDANLARFASLVPNGDTYCDRPGAGAAGGTAFGLSAWGAVIRPGALVVAETLGLPALIDGADLVVTGEGRYDGQTAGGKAPHQVALLAERAGVPVALVAGSIEAPTDAFAAAVSVAEVAGSVEAAMAAGREGLVAAGAELARRYVGA